jgi:hypothetical protein
VRGKLWATNASADGTLRSFPVEEVWQNHEASAVIELHDKSENSLRFRGLGVLKEDKEEVCNDIDAE